MSSPTSRTVITFGTFACSTSDTSECRASNRARRPVGDRCLCRRAQPSQKGRAAVFSKSERLAIVAALKPVDEVFVEESLELKRSHIEKYAADAFVIGDDWSGRFDDFRDICGGGLPAPHTSHLDHRTDREDLGDQLRAQPQHATHNQPRSIMRRRLAAAAVALAAVVATVPAARPEHLMVMRIQEIVGSWPSTPSRP